MSYPEIENEFGYEEVMPCVSIRFDASHKDHETTDDLEPGQIVHLRALNHLHQPPLIYRITGHAMVARGHLSRPPAKHIR